MEAYFEAKRRLFVDGLPAAVNIGDPHGSSPTSCAGSGQSSSPSALPTTPTSGRTRLTSASRACGAASTSRTFSEPRPPVGCSASSRARSPGSKTSRASPDGSSWSTRGNHSRSWSITRTRRRPSRTCWLAARGLGTGRVLCVFGCGGDRGSRQASDHGRDRRAARRRCDRHLDNPRSEEPRAIIDEIVAGAEAGSRSSRTAGRRSCAPSRRLVPAMSSSSRARATSRVSSSATEQFPLMTAKWHEKP